MKKALFILIMMVSLLLPNGCLQAKHVVSIEPTTQQPAITPNLIAITPPRITATGSIGIGDARIWVGTNRGLFSGGGYYPGATAEHVIPIYNDYDQDVQVELFFEIPGTMEGNYVPAPSYVSQWVTFEDKKPIITAKSKREILVSLNMPKDSIAFADNWEFRVTVVAMGQGKVQTAVSQRWFVTMRK